MRTAAHLSPIFLIFCLAPLPAQTTTGSQAQPPVFKTTAHAVVVDVVVTKGNEEPVPALTKQDFELKEDGKPQTIDFFEEHTTAPLPQNAPAAQLATPPNVYTNVPPAPESPAVNVLLLDTLNTPASDQRFVHNQILEFLKHIHPGTRVAIFTLGSRLRFVQGFTADTTTLLAALNDKKTEVTAAKDPASRTHRDDEADADNIQTMIKMAGGYTPGIGAVEDSMRDFSDIQLSERTEMTLDALSFLARYLSGVPGRKNLIWFSSSFPVTIFPVESRRLPTGSLQQHSSQIRETADLLTSAKIAVYPINATGLTSQQGLDIEEMGPANKSVLNSSVATDSSGSANTMNAMQTLATDTGGKPFYNTNDLAGALNRAINDGSHYYTVAYSPTNNQMDGRYRHIGVKLTKGNYKLAYRRGYNADDKLASASASGTDPLGQLLKHGLPSATGILYKVLVVPATIQPTPKDTLAGMNSKFDGARTRYFVQFTIPASEVALSLAPNSMHVGKFQLALLAVNREGNPLNWIDGTQNVNLNPDVYALVQKSGISARIQIDLPDTDVFLESGVYDWVSGKVGTLEIPVHVAPATPVTASQAAPKTE